MSHRATATPTPTGIASNTAIVFSANLAQMLIGFAATALIAALFGSAPAVDAFFIALPLPILVGQYTLSLTLLSLTPYYQRVCEHDGRERAQRRLAPLFWAALALAGVLGGALAFAATGAARVLAPGFDPPRLALLAENIRWAALAMPFLAGTNFLQAIANANQRFTRPAFARPLMTALACAVLLLFLQGDSLNGYFWGLALGAALGFLWQLAEVRSFGPWPLTLRGFGETWRAVRGSLGWLALARGLGQSSEIALQMIASLGAAGSVAAYAFGFKIAAIPLMLAVSLGVVLFPRQSAARVTGDNSAERRLLWRGVNALALLGALFGVFFFLWSEQIVTLLYERGDFNAALSETVGLTVRVFALALGAAAINNAIANSYWASGRLKERIALEALAIIVLLTVSLALVRDYGAPALALAYGLQFVILSGAGLWRLSGAGLWRELTPAVKITGAAVGCALVLWPLVPQPDHFRALTAIWRVLWLLGWGAGLTALFTASLYLAGIQEVRDLIGRLRGGENHTDPSPDSPAIQQPNTERASNY
ncbi:MAG TPA: lipid II flippase MurJ [candidate division Zixibacteria bacterium]|nr:lipid II flippase MurJ [candidate division Zixibacteria bacterium]